MLLGFAIAAPGTVIAATWAPPFQARYILGVVLLIQVLCFWWLYRLQKRRLQKVDKKGELLYIPKGK